MSDTLEKMRNFNDRNFSNWFLFPNIIHNFRNDINKTIIKMIKQLSIQYVIN